MSSISNPLDLYKHLEQSNCRQCLLPSCMAFAVAVIQGQKQLRDCPQLPEETITLLSGGIVQRKTLEEEQAKGLAEMQKQFAQQGFGEIAARRNLPVKEDRIGVRCLGKYFWIDAQGAMISECHTNNWVHGPVLNYLLSNKVQEAVGEWIPFRKIPGAADWEKFFSHSCEQEMQRLADAHTELFFDLLELFEAEELQGVADSDRSLVLYPLPNVPFLISYWEPEEPFASKLTLLFDRAASENIDPGVIYALSRGMVEMFRKLIVQHSATGTFFTLGQR